MVQKATLRPSRLTICLTCLLSLHLASSFAPIAAPGPRSLDIVGAFSASGRRKVAAAPLFVSPSTPTRPRDTEEGGDETRKSKPKSGDRVVYQKVVRSPGYVPDVLLLGTLMEFLETKFKLPARLAMTYDSLPVEGEEDLATLIFDSPLSPDPVETRMYVEIVGIFTPDKNKEDSDEGVDSATSSTPNMAMVAVKKKPKSPSSPAFPPMMKNLFADSEKKIIKALDRAIDDFATGRIRVDLNKVMEADQKEENSFNYETAEEAMQAELMLDEIEKKRQKKSKPEIQDAEVVDTTVPESSKPEELVDPYVNNDYTSIHLGKKSKPTKPSTDQKPVERKRPTALKEARAAAIASMNQDTPAKSTEKESIDDFAVKAAARKVSTGEMDFAVAAAKKRALENAAGSLKSMLSKKSDIPSKKQEVSKPKMKIPGQAPPPNAEPKVVNGEEMNFDPSTWRARDYIPREFSATISRPQDRRRKKKNSSSQRIPLIPKQNTATEAVTDRLPSSTQTDIPKSSESNDSRQNDTDEKLTPEPIAEVVPEQKLESSKEKSFAEKKSVSYPSREQLEIDIARSAQEALNEMVEQGEEMSAEDILRDVLKFDEEHAKENVPGFGFTSGAFEKAKELMSERKHQTSAPFATDVKAIEPPPPGLSADEELKKMFEAGQNIADSRLTAMFLKNKNSMRKTGLSEADEAQIDDLISQEKSISGHARVLDEELVELEMAVLKTPGEEFDGPPRNPMFDIMSGPEVYNPNVELDTVNFPGAIPGTKDVKLPKDLKEAVSQAQFAAKVLLQGEYKEIADEDGEKKKVFFSGGRKITDEQVENLHKVVTEATEIGIIEDPLLIIQERSRIQLVLDELGRQPEERYGEILSEYKDLLLSENFIPLVRERMAKNEESDLDALRNDDDDLKQKNERERQLLGHLVNYTQLLVKQTRALGAELEAQQLEIVRSICEVAMDPSLATEEETAFALSDAVRDMRPLLDDIFVSYIKYAVAEEEARLARAGLLDDPEHNQWLFVLKIVQQGVYTEVARGINRLIEHVFYVLRMETPIERRMLLKELIDVMPTMDVRPFVSVVDNIVSSLGTAVRGDFDGTEALGEMTNKLLQLHRDVKELLPPERIDIMARDADEWAMKQKEKLMKHRKIGMQRLEASRKTAHLNDKIESLGKRGEVERIPE